MIIGAVRKFGRRAERAKRNEVAICVSVRIIQRVRRGVAAITDSEWSCVKMIHLKASYSSVLVMVEDVG